MSIFSNSKYKKTLTYVNSFYNKIKFANGMENDEKNNLSYRKQKDYSIDNENKNKKSIERRNSMFSNIKIIEENLVEENEYDNLNNFFSHKYKSSCEENYDNNQIRNNYVIKPIDSSHLDPRNIKNYQMKKKYAKLTEKHLFKSRETAIYKNKKNLFSKNSIIGKNSKDISKSFILNYNKFSENLFFNLKNTLANNNDNISIINNDLYTQQMYGEKNSEIKWKNETTRNVWETLKAIKKKVKNIKNMKKKEIKKAIKSNNEEYIKNELKSEEFKKIYRNKDNLFSNDLIIKYFIKNNRFKMLEYILEDDAYQFNYDFIFDYIYNIIHPKDFKTKRKKNSKKEKKQKKLNVEKSLVQQLSEKIKSNDSSKHSKYKKIILENLIKNKLYPTNQIEKIKILAWFFCNYKYDNIFKILINDNIPFFMNEKKSFRELNYKNVYFDYKNEKIHFLIKLNIV